jgi:hypothetical protein
MEKVIAKKKFYCEAFFAVFIIVVLGAGKVFSEPLPGNVEKVFHVLSHFQKKNCNLGKIAQGQLPAMSTPITIPYENIQGLKETISQHWRSLSGVLQWKNYERDVFSFNSQGDFSTVNVFYFQDTNQTWGLEYESVFDYHAKGKASSVTNKTYSNGQWSNSGLLTMGYNQIDSVSSFSQVEWDSVRNDWKSSPMITGTISYNALGKIDTIKASIDFMGTTGQVLMTYTYLSDGKLNCEEMYAHSSSTNRRDRTFHFYPDALTEILRYEECDDPSACLNTDSMVIFYNQAGLILNSQKYSMEFGNATPSQQQSTTYDANNRPLVRLSMVGSQGTWVNDEQILFSYNTGHVKYSTNGFQKKSGLVAGSMLSDGTIILKSLSKDLSPVRIELYDIKGAMIFKIRLISVNGAASLRLNRIIAKGYYSCVVKQGDRTQTLGMIAAW